MWIANKASLCVFTKQCAVYLKHWQKMFGTSPSSSSSVIWKDCFQFFEDCGIIVPFFDYEEGELQWYITRSCTELPPKIDAEAMRELAKSRPYVSENENLRREESINITADWLLQRAKGVTDDQ
jgi:hypothetical protein